MCLAGTRLEHGLLDGGGWQRIWIGAKQRERALQGEALVSVWDPECILLLGHSQQGHGGRMLFLRGEGNSPYSTVAAGLSCTEPHAWITPSGPVISDLSERRGMEKSSGSSCSPLRDHLFRGCSSTVLEAIYYIPFLSLLSLIIKAWR